MNEDAPATAEKAGFSAVLVACGILFIILWIIAHIAWSAMALMADLMANDSGAASNEKHLTLIFGMLGGQVLCGAAGIPAGMAFYWRGKRKRLLGIFAALFVVGALLQAGVFFSFFASLP